MQLISICIQPVSYTHLDVYKRQHLAVAFESDPEADIRQLNSRRVELERALSNHENDNQQQRIPFEQAKEGVTALNLSLIHILAGRSWLANYG